ncbi:putative bifunctional diguanylate cyclase/phosphodiesterase [Geoalkalibacter sp.]|uniref:putative bifunctional diguanylate cyclase/phosphodiesterase n=1 Tax=Geoalkalibacter sp. TaxID=3041440 RepID=UPI00272ECB89|nr:EAL domain-containing protein [Geoalkalibacter sp.]
MSLDQDYAPAPPWQIAAGASSSMLLAEGRAGRFADARQRSILVAKARWIILALITSYGLVAGILFAFSDHGFFLSTTQFWVLLVSVLAVLIYNGLYHFGNARLRELPLGDSLQIALDLFLVTLLIHYSGGGASWFWPVYLIVTLEAAILLEEPRQVWGFGLLGGAFYGAMLVGEFIGLWPAVQMPFVEAGRQDDGLYLVLMWCWVSLLNATLVVVGTYLMGVIRRENLALGESEQRLRGFLETANDLIFSVDGNGRILYANRSWQQATGYDPARTPALTILDILHPETRNACYRDFLKVMAGDQVALVSSRFVARDGRLVDVEGSLTRAVTQSDSEALLWVICRDVSERKRAEAQLLHMAHHDLLTGLPNRACFMERLNQAISLAKRNRKMVAVLFLDLDRFKIINDTLGHPLGDCLLKEMGQRLLQCVREADTVARLGGDEFTICLSSLDQAEGAERVAGKILKALAQPVWLDGHELFITTSIGMSLFPGDGEDALGLIKKADIAMYAAKAQGRNNWQFYLASMDFDADRRLVLENSIRRAIEYEQFLLHYQPKVDIASGRVTAMEALVRWQHPELGLLPAGDFIPLAEETGLIFPLGEWVLREACAQNRRWQDQGLPPVRVAVNISGYQLQQKNLTEKIREILDETGLEARWLEIEVTETVVMQNPDFAVAVLKQLTDLGIHIAIDDFGTGYSSLAHLKRFSVNTLKIDKSFMRDIEISATDAAIATAIIAMGNSLKLQVIAEGVETEGQLDFLRKQSCQEMQGYLFSRPLPAEEVAELLTRSSLQQ